MGITYNIENEKFTFDFEYDGVDDIINLTGKGYQVKAFGQCFHYAYEFADDVQGSVRSAFIKYLKFPPTSLRQQPELTQFIQRAIDNLHHKINLYDYDLVITPESSSDVNEYMLRYIYRFAQPMMRQLQLVKALPENVSFDMDGYEQRWLNGKLDNGRPRYTEAQKEQVRQSISEMIDLIHKKEYFTIAKDVKKARLRPYITRFLKFEDEQDKKLLASIHNNNVLVVDDIATSGSTLNEVMRALRVMNEDNKITIFSLIGRQDLMAESI